MIIPRQRTVNQSKNWLFTWFEWFNPKFTFLWITGAIYYVEGGRWPRIFEKQMHYTVARASLNEPVPIVRTLTHRKRPMRCATRTSFIHNSLCLTIGPIPLYTVGFDWERKPTHLVRAKTMTSWPRIQNIDYIAKPAPGSDRTIVDCIGETTWNLHELQKAKLCCCNPLPSFKSSLKYHSNSISFWLLYSNSGSFQ